MNERLTRDKFETPTRPIVRIPRREVRFQSDFPVTISKDVPPRLHNKATNTTDVCLKKHDLNA